MPLHLTKHQRIELSLLRRLRHSQQSAAAVLGVSPSTISRELARNQVPLSRQRYHASVAERQRRARRAQANQVKRKFANTSPLTTLVTAKLTAYWSPEQIAGWLQATRHAARVCAQTIYGLFSCRAVRAVTLLRLQLQPS